MNREFLINILILIVVNFLIKPIYVFGIDLAVQNRVEGDYGIFFTIYSFALMFNIISDAGIRNFNNRNIAQHRFLLDKYFPNLLMLKAILGTIFMMVVLTGGVVMGYSREYPVMTFLITLNLFLSSVVHFFRSNISGLGYYKTDSFISILDRTLLIISCGFLLYHPYFKGQFEILWFVQTQTVTLVITALISFFIIFRKTKKLVFRLKLPFSLLILKKSWPYALVIFLMTAYSRLDAVMIEQMLPNGFDEADLYATAQRLFEACNNIGYLFGGLLVPMFARQIKFKEDYISLLRLSFQLIMAGALTLTISCIFFRQELMESLYVTGSIYTGNILAILMIGFVAVCGIMIYSSLLTANESLKEMNLVFVSGVVLNFVLNYFLIPNYKGLGAGMATLITQYFIFFFLIIISIKFMDVKTDLWLAGKIFLAIILISGSCFWIKRVLEMGWAMQFLTCLIAGILISMVIKLIHFNSFLDLLKKNRLN